MGDSWVGGYTAKGNVNGPNGKNIYDFSGGGGDPKNNNKNDDKSKPKPHGPTPEGYEPGFDPMNPGQIPSPDPGPPSPTPSPGGTGGGSGGNKGGGSSGGEPVLGITSTDKTVDLDNSRIYFDDHIGDKLTFEVWDGIVTGQEGSVATVDLGTVKGQPDGSSMTTVGDTEIGADENRNLLLVTLYPIPDTAKVGFSGFSDTFLRPHSGSCHSVSYVA
jgi:hypothetical protein